MTEPPALRPGATPQPRWQHPVLIVSTAMIVGQLAHRAWALSHSWFYTDDYLRLQEALAAPFGLEFLLRPDNGHLMPATRAVHWLFAHHLGLDWGAATAVAVTSQALASAAALWMLVVLFGVRWGVVPLLALYLTSAMTAQASLWWISALNQTPVQTGLFLAVGFWMTYLRTRRVGPLLGVLGSLAWGLLFFQKVLFVLPVLALLAVSYFASGTLAQRVRLAVRRYWPSAVLIGLVAGGFVAYSFQLVPSSRTDAAVPPWGELTVRMIDTFVAGVAGGPWRWVDRQGGAWADPPGWFRILAWAVVVGTVLASLALRRRAGRAWMILATYYVVLVATIAVTRAGIFGAEIGAAYRFQTEGLCVAVLALGLAWLPVRGATESSCPRPSAGGLLSSARSQALVVTTLTVAVAAAGMTSWARYVDSWTRVNDSRAFVERLGAESDRLPGAEVVDREVPESVLDEFTRPDNRLSDISALIAPGLRFPTVSERLTVVTDYGTINQALISAESRARGGPVADCGWPVKRDESVRVPVATDYALETRWIRVGYVLQDAGEVTVEVGDLTVRAPVFSGPNSLYVQATDAFDAVGFGGLTSQGALCVAEIEVGRPVAGPQQ